LLESFTKFLVSQYWEKKNPSTIEELDCWKVFFSSSPIIVKHTFNMPSTPCLGPFPLTPLEIIKGGKSLILDQFPSPPPFDLLFNLTLDFPMYSLIQQPFQKAWLDCV
jgi:hypothetical protein